MIHLRRVKKHVISQRKLCCSERHLIDLNLESLQVRRELIMCHKMSQSPVLLHSKYCSKSFIILKTVQHGIVFATDDIILRLSSSEISDSYF